jgi:hypothetical protein
MNESHIRWYAREYYPHLTATYGRLAIIAQLKARNIQILT